jgi:hypothetical protein
MESQMIKELALAASIVCGNPVYVKTQNKDYEYCQYKIMKCLGDHPEKMDQRDRHECFRKEVKKK